MKLVALLLAILSGPTVHAETTNCNDRVLIVRPDELIALEAKGALVSSPDDERIDISDNVLTILKNKGRVKTLNSVRSANCGGGLTDGPSQ